MKAYKFLLLAFVVVLGVVSASVYSSCSKDQCGAVFCQNHGTCNGGICKCPAEGIDGANCEIIYRKLYDGYYKGNSPYAAIADSTNLLRFTASTDTTNFNLMTVDWIDTGNLTVVSLPLKLSNNTSAGSQFTIDTVTIAGIRYGGEGNISKTSASLRLQKLTSGVLTTLNFNNYFRQ